MAYPLQSMLRIREMREDRAATDLTRARMARAEAERVRDEKHESRMKFEDTREERRDRIFATVIGRPVSLDELNQTRQAVQSIDEEAMLLLEAERKAENTLQEKTNEAEGARVRYVVAGINKEKIELHKDVWSEEERVERERAEDLEMEEFTGRKLEDIDA